MDAVVKVNGIKISSSAYLDSVGVMVPIYVGDSAKPCDEVMIAWEDLVDEVSDPRVGATQAYLMELAGALEEAAQELKVAASKL